MANPNGNISKYMEKYFDEKFGHIMSEIKDVKNEIKVIKNDMKKNGKCLHDINTTMVGYKFRIRTLFILVGFVITLLILGLANGLELITKGILSFLK
jgi:hypothetical protein